MGKVLITESILQDTADAIREKAGTVDTMKPSEFAENIENIPSGTDLSDYFTPTIGAGSSSLGGFVNMIKTIPSTTTVSGTNLYYAFYKFQGTTISLFDTSNITSMSNMFQSCPNLTSIPLFDTSNVTSMASMFNSCTSLTTIPLLNTSNVTNMANMFSGCPNLTDTSLDNILQMCINSGITSSGKKNLNSNGFNATNYPTSRIEALPHYQDFINAGWTIGYE